MLKNDPDLEYILAEIAREKKKRIIKISLAIGIPLLIGVIMFIILAICLF